MSKYLPTNVALSVFDVDYDTLYANGKRIILFDLDNTLISYYETLPTKELIELGKILLEKGFKTYVLTNNYESRIKAFTDLFPATETGFLMKKPFTYKIKKYLKERNITNYKEIIMIGDQLVTDIHCANRLGVDSILVKSISRASEKWYTVINRSREKWIVKRIAKKDYEFAMKIKEIIKKEKKHG